MTTVRPSFSVPEARRLLAGYFHHRPVLYWADFLVSLTIGYGFGAVYLSSPWLSPWKYAALVVAAFALFRVGSFIHEIVHFRRGQMRSFVVAWDLLAGVNMLMPSFFYANHIDHHNTHHYGTGQDGEYLPLGSGTLGHIASFYAQVLFMPAIVVFRFLVLTPISFLHPKLREWVLTHQSSYVINLKYRRRSISADTPRLCIAVIEWLCFVRTAIIFVAPMIGLRSWDNIPQLYLISVCVLGLNYIRNVVAHLYQGHGESMSHADQLLDSVNIEGGKTLGGPITELFFPLGLRYHGLHHLFPALPYHNLYAAHRKLMADLPADSGYRTTVYPSFWAALAVLWGQTQEAASHRRAAEPTGSDRWYDRRATLLARYRRPADAARPSVDEAAAPARVDAA